MPNFTDALSFDTATKTAISVRDGVQSYYGMELGMQPFDKVFTIYRSPATIANCVNRLSNIPLTDEHVTLDETPQSPCGSVVDSVLVDNFDAETHSTLAVKNTVSLDGAILDLIQSGKKELSLGYRANLKPHDRYDFEQTDIEPHHLAVVSRGRCGGTCSFIDKQGEFMDEEKGASPTLAETVDIAVALPEAIKNMTIEELQEVLPVLQSIVNKGKEGEKSVEAAEAETDEPEAKQADEMPVEEPKEDEPEDKEEKVKITDTAEFMDAVTKAVEAHTVVIEKARDFVDAGYSFVGKSTTQIMRDALAVEHGNQKFEDSELPVAFKLLKKTASSLKNFGDSGACPFDSLKDKEL